jgi:hypothetical protein
MKRNPDVILLAVLMTLYFLVGVLMFASKAEAQGDVTYCSNGTETIMVNAPHNCPPGYFEV